MIECYEFISGNHAKFWTVETIENHYIVTYGKIGTKGATQVKTMESQEAARMAASKMIRQKKDKGYIEVSEGKHPGADPSLRASLLGRQEEESRPVSRRGSSTRRPSQPPPDVSDFPERGERGIDL